MTTTNTKLELNWENLLTEAVTKPGKILAAYSLFHNYSLANAMLALIQCEMRGIQPGPINTFPGWKALGRHVIKGQKAISLVMPITYKKRDEENQQAADTADRHDSRKSECFTRFVFRPTGLYCLRPKATTLPPRPRRTGMQSGRFPRLELLAWSLRR